MQLHDLTPIEQLEAICDTLRNPKLPGQELNRLLMCRQAWRQDRGLPTSARRAFEQLTKHIPNATPKNTQATAPTQDADPRQVDISEVIKGKETPAQAEAILSSGEKLHHATKERLERLVAAKKGA